MVAGFTEKTTKSVNDSKAMRNKYLCVVVEIPQRADNSVAFAEGTVRCTVLLVYMSACAMDEKMSSDFECAVEYIRAKA